MTTEPSPQRKLEMKTNPHGTGVPVTIHPPQTGVIRRHRFYSPKSLCPYSQGSELPSFAPGQSFYVGSDALARQTFSQISLQINLDHPTSVPFRYTGSRANIPPRLAQG